jgi:flavin reductase (DIM6/NTAB) family NADH-FMN oxidoreductase RutF
MDVVQTSRDDSGIALLTGSIGHLGCATQAIHEAGDHSIVVGSVESIVHDNFDAPALVYLDHHLTGL